MMKGFEKPYGGGGEGASEANNKINSSGEISETGTEGSGDAMYEADAL